MAPLPKGVFTAASSSPASIIARVALYEKEHPQEMERTRPIR
jgi:hypothetical protein